MSGSLSGIRVAIVGGAGFIGHHLLAAVHKDWRVTSYDGKILVDFTIPFSIPPSDNVSKACLT